MATSTRDPLHAVTRVERIHPITEQQLQDVRRLVERNVPHGEVRELLEMLGVSDPPALRVLAQEDAA